MDLAAELDRLGLSDSSRRLSRVLAARSEAGVRALLVGRFSVGKSTLINAFLGYPILPGGMAPTTGGICRLSFGDPGAIVRFNDGRIEAFSGPESVASYLAMDPARPDSYSRLLSVVRVDITLPLPLLQHGLEIVDSPGIDEEAARTDVATEGIESADIVLLVVSAEQAMGEIEQRFLSQEILPRRPGASAMIVNFWDRISPRDRPAVLERLRYTVRDSGAEGLPIFPISAVQAVRQRWRPRPGERADCGIEALEDWLRSQAADGPAIQGRAAEGRVHYALRTALTAVEASLQPVVDQVHDLAHEASAARASLADCGGSLARAEVLADGSGEQIQQSLATRVSDLDGRIQASITHRLQKNPYDPLEAPARELSRSWEECLRQTQEDAGHVLVAAAGALFEAGAAPGPSALPPLRLRVPTPSLDVQAAPDATLAVRNTITGLLDTISSRAGDTASEWLGRASRAAAGVDPRVRVAPERARESLERALAMGAYEARRQISAWAQEAQKAILDAAATRRKILQEAASGKDRAAREAHMHLNKRTAAAEEIRTLLHDLTTGPSPPKSDDST